MKTEMHDSFPVSFQAQNILVISTTLHMSNANGKKKQHEALG